MGFFDKIKNATEQIKGKISENLSEEKINALSEKFQNTVNKAVDKVNEKTKNADGEGLLKSISKKFTDPNVYVYVVKFSIKKARLESYDIPDLEYVDKTLNEDFADVFMGHKASFNKEKDTHEFEVFIDGQECASEFKSRVRGFYKVDFNVDPTTYYYTYDKNNPTDMENLKRLENKKPLDISGIVKKVECERMRQAALEVVKGLAAAASKERKRVEKAQAAQESSDEE